MNSHRHTKPRRRLLHQPQPVIDRWVRQWITRKLAPKFTAIARAYMRPRLRRKERARQKALLETFETTLHYAMINEGGQFPAISVLLNIGLYLLLAERDIQAIKIDTLTHPDEWTRKLNARVILLTIYEWDADKVSGRSLKEALDMIEAPENLRQEAVDALRRLRLVQRKARTQFSVVRNAAIAHRDPDALLQYRAIRDLKTEQVIEIAMEFYEDVGEFMRILSKLLLECSPLRMLLRQWKERPAATPI